MKLLKYKKFEYLEELKDILEYVIDDNDLESRLNYLEDLGIISITINRKDPDIFKKGNLRCPSNQKSADFVDEAIGRIKQLEDSKIFLEIEFSYSIGKTIKSDKLRSLSKEFLKNIESNIKNYHYYKNEINQIWITRFVINLKLY